jgi:NAD(P) transhydrogenase subunit beta
MLNITALSYLVCSVLFILALKGLSSPTTSRQGNTYGMIGMALAVVTTFLIPSFKPVIG